MSVPHCCTWRTVKFGEYLYCLPPWVDCTLQVSEMCQGGHLETKLCRKMYICLVVRSNDCIGLTRATVTTTKNQKDSYCNSPFFDNFD